MIRSIFVFCLLPLMACCTTAQNASRLPTPTPSPVVKEADKAPSQNPNLFIEAKARTEYPFSVEFHWNGHKYEIGEDGRGKRTGEKSVGKAFDLKLHKYESLERHIYLAKYNDDLLIICESQLEDGGAGFIVRLNRETLKVKWKAHIPAFNVGQGLLDHKFAYVTGIGFIGKVDLDSGTYVWQHDDLYGRPDDEAFNSFEAPDLKDGVVKFTEAEIHFRTKVASLQVDAETGKILKIDR